MNKDSGATKQDIANLTNEIEGLRVEMREVMGEFTQEILGALSPAIQDIHATTARIENKLDATADHVDNHEIRIGKLEHRVA